MKLVIENKGGILYAMFETEKHHKHIGRAEYYRVDANRLDEECDLAEVLGPEQYMVIDAVKPRKASRGRKVK